MSNRQTARSSRLVITLLGRRNVGKSLLLNALCGQVSSVSSQEGATTDPVLKHYELLPLGPVTFYDTVGTDDSGELGLLRVQASKKIVSRSDMIIFVVAGGRLTTGDMQELELLLRQKVPLILVQNKIDLHPVSQEIEQFCRLYGIACQAVSARQGRGIDALKATLISHVPDSFQHAPPLVSSGRRRCEQS
ncbi:GTPase [Desulfotalea psychrophila]|nr:GTPase [Desulfotalea psychrophila]